jgi:DNA-binding IclR family transcriptional regulator
VVAPAPTKQYSSSVQKKTQMRTIEKPTYLLESVDNALRLLQMLRDLGVLRLTDAAQELGIAPSTAHRLFAMLVYRGFAVQDEKRAYHPGPAMGAGPAQRGWTREFNDRCRPHMEALSSLCGETVNLVIRVGTQVRFLSSAESIQMLRIGDRQGQVLAAERTAGGRILLAELPRDVLAQLYMRPATDDQALRVDRRLPPDEFDAFHRDLQAAKGVGFALNVEQTEDGVTAFGVAVRNRAEQAIGALSVSVPITRFRQHSRGPLVSQMKNAVRELEVDVADIQP